MCTKKIEIVNILEFPFKITYEYSVLKYIIYLFTHITMAVLAQKSFDGRLYDELWNQSQTDDQIIRKMIVDEKVHFAYTFGNCDSVERIVDTDIQWFIPKTQYDTTEHNENENITYFVNPNMCTTSVNPFFRIVGKKILHLPVANQFAETVTNAFLREECKNPNSRYVYETYVYHGLNEFCVHTTFFHRMIEIDPITIDDVVYTERKIVTGRLDCEGKCTFCVGKNVKVDYDIDDDMLSWFFTQNEPIAFSGLERSEFPTTENDLTKVENMIFCKTAPVKTINFGIFYDLPELFSSFHMPTFGSLNRIMSLSTTRVSAKLHLQFLTIDDQPSLKTIGDRFLSNTTLKCCIIRNMPSLMKIGCNWLSNNPHLEYLIIENMPVLTHIGSFLVETNGLTHLTISSLPRVESLCFISLPQLQFNENTKIVLKDVSNSIRMHIKQ